MNILFDHQIFILQKYGGISRYHYELNSNLNLLENCHSTISLINSENAYLSTKNKWFFESDKWRRKKIA